MDCMSCYQRVENAIGKQFEKYGRFVARHPWKIIIFMILVNGLLGIGMMKLKVEKELIKVYTPRNSQASIDSKKIKNTFPDTSGTDYYSYQSAEPWSYAAVIIKPTYGDVMNVTFLKELQRLHDYFNATVAEYRGRKIHWEDVCAKRYSKCHVIGEIFFTEEFRKAAAIFNVTFPEIDLPGQNGTVNIGSLVADPMVVNDMMFQAAMLRIKLSLRTDSEYLRKASKEWQDSFLESMENFESEILEVAYSHSSSLSEELNANIGGDIRLFSVTFTLMITFACIATGSARYDCVGQRMNLGFAGVIAAVMAIVASFGLCSLIGVEFVSVIGNAPFLIIGIGVDDMFILLSGLADAPYGRSVEDRIGFTMRTSGVAITITSLTDFLAFASGATSSIMSVSNFCIYTGVAVIFTYMNQATFFTACLALHEKRVQANRHYATCRPTKSREEMKAENASTCRILCCAGSPPQSRDDVESFIEKLPRFVLPKIVLCTPIKALLLLIFAGYLGVSIWGAIGLEQGLVIKNLVSPNSYYFKYSEWEDEFFLAPPISFIINEPLTYSDPSVQEDIQALIDAARNDTAIRDPFQVNWLDEYMNSKYYHDSSNETSFILGLEKFFSNPEFARYKNDVVISGNHITSSRMYVFSERLTSTDQGAMMLRMRDVAYNSPLFCFAFSPPFIFFEQYVTILPQTLQTVGIALAAVFVVTCIFMPHPLLLVLVTLSIAMIMVGVFGFMHLWGLTLSSVTMIHIIMSVGFSVDFAAHICHAYMMADGSTRDDRVKASIRRAGSPIFNGAASSIIGIMMLAFAKSYIFKSFFQVMLLVILFGLGQAIFFLPVVLSLIGPVTKPEVQHRGETYKKAADRNGHPSPLEMNKK